MKSSCGSARRQALTPLAYVAVLALLSGCASNESMDASSDEIYVGWHCEGDINSRDDWQCQQRRMRNGVPVDNQVIGETDAAAVEREMASSITVDMASGKGIKATADDAAEPGAPTQVALASEQPGASAPRRRRPPPIATPGPTPPEPSFSPDTVSTSSAEQAESSAPADTPAPGRFDINHSGYTLQFGAFSERDTAYEAGNKLQLQDGPLQVTPIRAGGKTLYVLVYGNYNSSGDANKQGAAIRRRSAGTEFWVRSMGSLRAAAQ